MKKLRHGDTEKTHGKRLSLRAFLRVLLRALRVSVVGSLSYPWRLSISRSRRGLSWTRRDWARRRMRLGSSSLAKG